MAKTESVDIEISEKVAQKAGEQMNALKKEIERDKNAHISLLEDILQDVKEQRKFLKSALVSMIVVVILVILGSFGLSLYNQKLLADSSVKNTEKIFDFISNTDFNFNAEMNTDSNSEINGDMTISR